MLLLEIYSDCRRRSNKLVEVGKRQKLREKLLTFIDTRRYGTRIWKYNDLYMRFLCIVYVVIQ